MNSIHQQAAFTLFCFLNLELLPRLLLSLLPAAVSLLPTTRGFGLLNGVQAELSSLLPPRSRIYDHTYCKRLLKLINLNPEMIGEGELSSKSVKFAITIIK